MEGAAALIMVLLTVGLAAVAVAMARSPGRFDRYLSERFWRRAMVWALVPACGAALAGMLGGADGGSALILGLAVEGVVFLFWTLSKTFGPR